MMYNKILVYHSDHFTSQTHIFIFAVTVIFCRLAASSWHEACMAQMYEVYEITSNTDNMERSESWVHANSNPERKGRG